MNASTTAERSITLQDGRRMGYAVFGDPVGRPCLFVHGYSSSRWSAGWTFSNATLHRQGVRLIAVDRPGYGLSTANPGAGFLDWARDASALTDQLGLDRVAVIGVSMGAGPALALTATHPALVTSTTILGGMPPVAVRERWAPASRADAFYWRLARRAPWLLRRLCSASAAMMATAARGDTGKLIGRVERGLPGADLRIFRELLNDADNNAKAAFIADVRESCHQGGAAMADDLRQYLRPWGFDPVDVRRPVHLWHGLEDPKVPIMLARRLADRLPQGTSRFVPGGHFASFAHRDEIIGRIADE
ncbi:alpha/beta hydrolase [Streptosporangium sp. NPDC006013]|uniref:alpha/beta fold hydrolase n=1 Tax=Streptosporangium sp. NPDC006013 TaxID=3155596 RepID=UPI0033A0D46A